MKPQPASNLVTASLRASCAIMLGLIATAQTFAADEQPPAGHQSIVLRFGDLDRHYLLHLPPDVKSGEKIPLVVMLHGGGGSSRGTIRETGWSDKADKADKAGFAVAYPDATPPDRSKPGKFRGNPPTWNDGSGRWASEKEGVDDVGFIRAMIDDVVAKQPINPKRVYVAGFSNGASMTFRVGGELSDRVAAIATVAGTCWNKEPKLTRGVPLCYISGTTDPLNPLNGGALRFGLGGKDKPTVQASIDIWVKAIGAPNEAAKTEEANGVKKVHYGPGRDGAEVVFITVEGLGHIWAGGVNLLPEVLVGKDPEKLNATDVVWQFFAGHSLP